jgi:RimJ/RimL family protein N-acetyltransferase
VLNLRAVGDAEEFVGMPDDPDDYAETVRRLWTSGESKPEWCFLLEEGDARVARVGFKVASTTTDPRWLGSLPPLELFLYGLDLPWAGDFLGLGRRLLFEAIATMADEVPTMLEVRINKELHLHTDARRRLMEECGMKLFQEKQGFSWADDGTPIEVPNRLDFRTIDEIGPDAYRSVMARCGDGTLDRNDRYYWGGCGADNWAAQMTALVDDADAPMWLEGYKGDSPVGYVAVAREPDWGSTIVHIGVVPEHRGNGYIDDLLAAGTAAAQRNGIGTMLSDVDVLNKPMMKAMRRAGHRGDQRPWHVWVYRTDVLQMVSRRL